MRGCHATHAATLDQLPETASPPEPNSPRGEQVLEESVRYEELRFELFQSRGYLGYSSSG